MERLIGWCEYSKYEKPAFYGMHNSGIGLMVALGAFPNPPPPPSVISQVTRPRHTVALYVPTLPALFSFMYSQGIVRNRFL
jgi:hypothetical protein